MSNEQTAAPKEPRKLGSRDGLFQRGGWWWLDYTDAEGRRHRKKAAPDYDTAKKKYRATMTAIARGDVLGVREEGIRLRDFVEKRYWPTVRPTLSAWEQNRARASLDRQILPRFGDMRLSKLRREDIERWQAERLTGPLRQETDETATRKARSNGVLDSTVNKELMRLKHLLNRAVSWGYLKDSPARLVKKAKEGPGRVRYLTPEERETLLNGAPPALRPYIVGALQTGARRGELLGLRWADVDMRARTITFPKTKNGDSRSVPMTDTLRALFQGLPRPVNSGARVFHEWEPAALSVAFGRLVRALKLTDLRFHDLRHDTASTLTMAGVPQRTVMALLGHRDPRMTLRYQHLSPEHLRDAVRSLDQRRAPAKVEVANDN